ncbi:PilZ domain-containing protein [Granulicella sibirica]|uniref:PilZ domain-containing protein n=1 Tax=Granulicella sibirica TaxID=2479048 RepID=A0A4Q0SZT9_9BACT|nr:PilZ domain-containing protein [Granulicella sibirica]RXH56427.1 hypothetical protein GRAN_3284 [Granulicella sibirica]
MEGSEFGGRRHVRVGYSGGTVTVRCNLSGPFLPGSLIDISISGCLILMQDPLPVTPSQVIELHFDLNSLAFRVLGFVRHARKPRQIGVEFHHLSEQARSDLEGFIDYFAPAGVNVLQP